MSFKEIAAYSLGLFGFQAIVGLLNSYQAEFDASILGADIAVVGILVLVAKILSAVFDPFVGNMIDRSKSKNGKFKSMIAKSILPLLVMSAVVFIDVPFKPNGAPTRNRRVKSVGKNYSIHIDTGKFTVYNKINLV